MFEKAKKPVVMALIAANLGGIAAAGARAGTKEALGRETQSPKAYLAFINKQMAGIESRIKSTDHKQVVMGNDPRVNGLPDAKLYFISEPSKTMAHRFNVLGVLTRKDYKNPLQVTVVMNSKFSTFGKGFKSATKEMSMEQMSPVGDFTPDQAELSVIGQGKFANFRVAAIADSDFSNTEYLDKPAEVASQVDQLFKTADEILDHN